MLKNKFKYKTLKLNYYSNFFDTSINEVLKAKLL